MKKILLIMMAVCIVLPLRALNAQEVVLTLKEAKGILLRDNADVVIQAEEILKAQQKVNESRAEWFPSLELSGNWSRTQGLYAKDSTAITTQAQLKQSLYTSGSINSTIKYNEGALKAAESVLEKVQLEKIELLKKAYYSLIIAQEFAGINKAIKENTEEHLLSLRLKYQAGESSSSDILSLESSLAKVMEAYEVSLNQIDSAQAVLGNLLNVADDVRIIPADGLSYEEYSLAYDEAFVKAMRLRPEIRQYEAEEVQAKAAVALARSGAQPEVYASWDYYNRSTITATPTKNWNDYNVIGVTVSWPVFDGFSTRAKVQQALSDVRNAQTAKEKAKRDIALEVKNAWLALKDTISGLRSSKAEVAVYEDYLRIIEEKHRQGEASLLDLEDARLKYSLAQFSGQERIYDYLVARSSFEKATGGI